jgi:catechol 2,3-dioxygenase-like lactoylglutathione lyase family enzyme
MDNLRPHHATEVRELLDRAGIGLLYLPRYSPEFNPIEHGPMHIAFSISAGELDEWQRHLTDAGVSLEGRTQWPRGGASVYFRDPDDHLLEIATPGLWKGY